MCRDQDARYRIHLKTRIQNNQTDTFVVIVPTDAARLKRQRELVGYHPNRAVATCACMTSKILFGGCTTRYVLQDGTSHQDSKTSGFMKSQILKPDNSDAYRYEAFRPNPDVSVPDSTLSLIVDTINTSQGTRRDRTSIVADNSTKTDLVHIYNNYEANSQNVG